MNRNTGQRSAVINLKLDRVVFKNGELTFAMRGYKQIVLLYCHHTATVSITPYTSFTSKICR